jgi:hypothetical protein
LRLPPETPIEPCEPAAAGRSRGWGHVLGAGVAATALVVGAAAAWGRPEQAAAGGDQAAGPTTTSLVRPTTTTTVAPVVPEPRATLEATDCRTWPDLEATVAADVTVDPIGIAVSVIDLADGCSYGVNNSTELYAASTIKLLALAGVLESAQVEERPLTDDERELATSMMQYSDNDAASLLIDELEWRGESFADLGARWGVPGAQNPSWGLSEVTASEMAGLVAKMFDGTMLDGAAQEEAKAFLDLPDPDFSAGWRIAVGYGLPEGWYDGSKVGQLLADDGGLHLHGVGLVESPVGHRYAVAVLGSGWDSYADTDTAMVELDAIGESLSCLMSGQVPATCVADERPDPAGDV